MACLMRHLPPPPWQELFGWLIWKMVSSSPTVVVDSCVVVTRLQMVVRLCCETNRLLWSGCKCLVLMISVLQVTFISSARKMRRKKSRWFCVLVIYLFSIHKNQLPSFAPFDEGDKSLARALFLSNKLLLPRRWCPASVQIWFGSRFPSYPPCWLLERKSITGAARKGSSVNRWENLWGNQSRTFCVPRWWWWCLERHLI